MKKWGEKGKVMKKGGKKKGLGEGDGKYGESVQGIPEWHFTE